MKQLQVIIGWMLMLMLLTGFTLSAQTIRMAQDKPTGTSLRDELNLLINQNTEAAKAKLTAKTDSLAGSKKEADLMLAHAVFKTMEDSDKLAAIDKRILKQFPKGQLARDNAYQEQVGRHLETLSAKEIDSRFRTWLKKYPKAQYPMEQQGQYDFVRLILIKQLVKLKAIDLLETYLQEMQDPNWRTMSYFYAAEGAVDAKDNARADTYLAEAMRLSTAAKNADDAKLRNGFAAMLYPQIADLYAKNNMQLGKPELAVEMLKPILEASHYKQFQGAALSQSLAKAYQQLNKPFQGFLVMDRYLNQNNLDSTSLQLVEDLYNASNQDKAGFDSYLQFLQHKKQQELMAHLSSKMIEKPMPDFSLMDMDGNKVNLADYKGKILVIDFWATWCVPCIKSFPGMQASIEKYKAQSDVAFLFVNVWEKGADFKKRAHDFIQQNQYDFKLVFDEASANNTLLVDKLNVKSIPTKLFVDGQGVIRYMASGSETGKEAVMNEVSGIIELIRSSNANAL